MGIMIELSRGLRERTRYIKGTESVEIYDEIKPREGDIVIEKHRYSAFYGLSQGSGAQNLIAVQTTS
jgi:nicotinamidase-related amidase